MCKPNENCSICEEYVLGMGCKYNEVSNLVINLPQEKTVRLNDIVLPQYFIKSLPSPWKIHRQYSSYLYDGNFTNRMFVNANMVLLDGYTQYLVCRMLGIDNVTVWQNDNIEID